MNLRIGLLLFFIVGFYTTDARVIITNGLTHVHQGARGEKIQGKIELQNHNLKSNRILAYTNDLVPRCNGNMEYMEGINHTNSIASWLKPRVNDKQLAKGEAYELNYTVEIPDNIKDGSYWGILMVEVADPIKEEYIEKVGLQSKIRYAVQIIINVGDKVNPELEFKEVSLVENEGEVTKIKIELYNKGAFFAPAEVSFEILDEEGEVIKVTKSALKKMYPGYCNTYEISLESYPQGSYDGLLIADNGQDLFGSSLSLEIR